MRVILNQNVENLGSVGEVLKVRDGYARNFLIPQGLAELATPSSVRLIEKVKAEEIKKEKEHRAEAEQFAGRITAASCTVEVNAGADDKLFGSVSQTDIQAALASQGIEVDKKNILIKSAIKKLGAFQVDVHCYTNLKAPLKVWVVRKKQ